MENRVATKEIKHRKSLSGEKTVQHTFLNDAARPTLRRPCAGTLLITSYNICNIKFTTRARVRPRGARAVFPRRCRLPFVRD